MPPVELSLSSRGFGELRQPGPVPIKALPHIPDQPEQPAASIRLLDEFTGGTMGANDGGIKRGDRASTGDLQAEPTPGPTNPASGGTSTVSPGTADADREEAVTVHETPSDEEPS